jgi:hypothetical protein
MITADHIRAVLNYDLLTGIFTWKTHKYRHDLIGKKAGSPTNTGYWAISIDNKKRLAHRLAWLYVTGEWPIEHIDHKDGNKQNNSFANLRAVSRFENLQNMREPTKANKSNFLGVSAHQGKWRAQICVNGKRIRKSGFDTPKEAHEMYLTLKRIYHTTCTI